MWSSPRLPRRLREPTMACGVTVIGLIGRLPFDVPVTPSPEQAHQWAVDELSKDVYNQRESLWEMFTRWLSERFNSLQGIGSNDSRLITIVVVAVLIAVVIAILFAVRRAGRLSSAVGSRRGSTEVLLDDARSAADMRSAAQVAAASGNFSLAVVERFRAIARSLEDRTILEERPGRTAREVCFDATPRLPQFADDLRWAADLFDVVCYSEADADRNQYERMVLLDDAIAAARPVPRAQASETTPTLAVPS